MIVNGVALRGSLTIDTVFSSICAGLHKGTAPDVCNQCVGCENLGECVTKEGSCPKSSESPDDVDEEREFEIPLWYDEDQLEELLMPVALKCFTQDVSLSNVTTKVMSLLNTDDDYYGYGAMMDEIPGMMFE